MSQVAALNVLNDHRRNQILSIKKNIKTHGSIPGRCKQIYCTNPSQEENNEFKLEKFKILLKNFNSLEELRKLSWSGIPTKLRGTIWRILCGYLPINSEKRNGVLERKREEYWELVEKYCYIKYDGRNRIVQHQINIDVPRTNPSISLFQQTTVQHMYVRILFIWSIRHPTSSYVQGINDLVTPFYIVFLQELLPNNEQFEKFQVDLLMQKQLKIIEADTFWCFSNFLDNILDNYAIEQSGIQNKMVQLEKLIKRVDQPLHKQLKEHDVSYLQFSFRWFNNLLTRELPLICTIRLWDTYLAEHHNLPSFQLYVCVAFLLHWRDDLMQQSDFQGLLMFLQSLPTQSWTSSQINVLVAEAFKLKCIFDDVPSHLLNDSIDA